MLAPSAMGEGLTQREVVRRKMLAFYSRHVPEKLSSVDAILEQYRGQEDVVIRAMQVKYPAWNFDYLPPDLTSVLGPQARSPPPSAGTLPPPLSPTIFPNLPPVAVPPSPPRGVATRDELHEVVATLHDKLLTQQRTEMSALETKIQQLVDIAQDAHRRRDTDEQRRREDQAAEAAKEERRNTIETMRTIQDQVQTQRMKEAEKDMAMQSLHQQVEQLTTVLQKRDQEQVAQETQAYQQQQQQQQQQQHQQQQELEDLRVRESQRIRTEIQGQSEMERVRRENDLLREEGEEGRELIMELHGVVEQLRHANQSKTSEIETLLSSAQTIKGYYESSQRQLEHRQVELDREKTKAQQAITMAAHTMPPPETHIAPYSPMYGATSPATLAANPPQMPAPLPPQVSPVVSYVPVPVVQQQQRLQTTPGRSGPLAPQHVSAGGGVVTHTGGVNTSRVRAGISPPRPASQATNTFNLMASLQRRAYENMGGVGR